jgi:hypothetical protein
MDCAEPLTFQVTQGCVTVLADVFKLHRRSAGPIDFESSPTGEFVDVPIERSLEPMVY